MRDNYIYFTIKLHSKFQCFGLVQLICKKFLEYYTKIKVTLKTVNICFWPYSQKVNYVVLLHHILDTDYI